MAKQKTHYVCSDCGHREPKWSGRCPECGEWNTFSEVEAKPKGQTPATVATASVPLAAVAEEVAVRTSSGIDEVNRVLGGGIVRGSAVLVGGEPGIGKSTLMLQIAAKTETKGRVLYVSGEESSEQIRARASRLELLSSTVEVLCETNLDAILATVEVMKPVMLIVDSIQTLVSDEAGPVPGTVNQIKFATHALVAWSRRHGAALFMVAHVTKEGSISGPKVIEHVVDTVLYFDQSDTDLRILRANKNRFGSVNEIGLFTMKATGLEEVRQPDLLFLHHRSGAMPAGVVVAPVFEGTRILLVEIQALVVPAKGSFSRVFSERIDSGRVSRISAVIEKHLGLRFSDQDIYVNIAGGMRISEVGVELPLALALHSARTSVPIQAGTAAAGELTLAGEIRPIQRMETRANAVRELTSGRMIGPAPVEPEGKLSWIQANTISDAVEAVFS